MCAKGQNRQNLVAETEPSCNILLMLHKSGAQHETTLTQLRGLQRLSAESDSSRRDRCDCDASVSQRRRAARSSHILPDTPEGSQQEAFAAGIQSRSSETEIIQQGNGQ